MEMTHPVDRMLRLWSVPPPDNEVAAVSAFREVYADPYSVNGEYVPLSAVVGRARTMHAGLADLRHDVLDRIDSGHRTVLVMRQLGRHTGPLATQLGTWQPTGVALERRIIEVGGIHLSGPLQVRTLAMVEPPVACPRSVGGPVVPVVRAASSSAAGRRPGRDSAPARGRRRVPARGRRPSLYCGIDVG